MVFAIATISYLLTMEPTTSLWDCSEFIATSYKLEVGHPPGAPLFMILARIATLFAPSTESVAAMVNAMNCIASGFCILFLFWTITHLARRITTTWGDMSAERMIMVLGAGAVGALAYAYTDTFWFSAVEGEVYALSSMFTALVVWLMLKWEENADKPTAMRWIILIAYLMGLSIGVHILNLLTIPALVMIYFFRRTTPVATWGYVGRIAVALFVSLLILGVINGIIIPYTVALGAAVDTFVVNTFGWRENVGMVIFVVVLFVVLGALILFTHCRGYRVLNAVALAIAVIFIGFSSYASVTIRAAANPPMNSNNPSNPHALLSLLNRDQYGNRPLLVGPYYSARPLPVVAVSDDVEAEDYFIPTGNCEMKEMMWLNPETGKYEAREIFDDYKYPSSAMHLLPRMWHHSRRDSYERGWIAMEEGHPTVRRQDAAAGVWYEPTAAEDMAYFLGYQMGDMFWRYFMWNFVGRQDDTQLEADPYNRIYMHGGWISGIDFIDKFFVGPQSELPSEMENNPARNTYFFLPLLLGLLGLVYQLNVDWRNFIVVMLLFVMMGIALVVYFNTAPDEPRERDYVYAGAFYAFSIWIGLGVVAIGDMLMALVRRLAPKSNNAVLRGAVVCAVLLSASVPVVLAAENWDDHDRSGRYMARDIGRNYLNTVPKNGIIINFGDNDTFPLWYVQEVEGLRKDVRVMNSSYLGGEWYIDEMKLAANDADGVPFTIPSTKYSFVNDWTMIVDVIDVLDTAEAREMRALKRYIDDKQYYNISYTDSHGRRRTVSGGYATISARVSDAQEIISQYQPIIEDYIAAGLTDSDEFYNLYLEYTDACDLFDAIVADDTYMDDYDFVGEYWDYNDRISSATLYLKDAIRLFISDEPMTLVINDGRMRLLADGEVISQAERKDDYQLVGRLRPTVDSSFDGVEVDYILRAPKYAIAVDKDAAIASGIVEESDRERMVDDVYISLQGKSLLTKDHLMMLDLFANFDWKRPLSFTQTHLMRDYGVVDYARFDGYSYSFVPILTRYKSGGEVGTMDCDKLYPLLVGEVSEDDVSQPIAFGNLAAEGVYVDYFYRYNIASARLRENFARVATDFLRRGTEEDVAKAEALLDRGLAVLPSQKIGYAHTNTLPYLRGYYTVAQYYLQRATELLDVAVSELNVLLDINRTVENLGDNFLYFYELSDAAAELLATAQHRGLDVKDIMSKLALSDDYFARAEENYHKGDTLAMEYVAVRGEWAKYYLQYATYDSFSPRVSQELSYAMLDVIEALDTSHILGGSFDWVANPDAEKSIVAEPLEFDRLVMAYLKAVERLTPASVDDVAVDVVANHICNLFDIYSKLPAARYDGDSEYVATYIEPLEDYLSRSVPNEVLQMYGMIE